MTERQEELAALEALHMLEAEEARVFAGEIKYSPQSAKFVAELQEAAAEIALLLPSVGPPADCRAKILTAIANRPNEAQLTRKKSRIKLLLGVAGWAAAIAAGVMAMRFREGGEKARAELTAYEQRSQAAIADASALRQKGDALAQQLTAVQQHNESLTKEVAGLKKSNELASLEVSSLKALNKSWEEASAVIVWDNAKQEGILKMSKMRPVTANKDYQLWVVDKDKAAPVSAGVVRISDQGVTAYTFKPVEPITSAQKFAVSIENKGGVEKVEGPIIMAGP